jgi:Mycothiol maleylpyruvate isomerase N-terminal domain
MTTQPLIDDLTAARIELFDVLDAVAPGSMTTPGLLGEWSGRELIAHLGYWAGHAVEVIHAVEEGRAGEVGAGEPPTDEVNATVARVARETDLPTVRKREAASVEVLVERLRRMDLGLLGVPLPDGATLEEGIREDGSDHYREHAEDLRRALAEGARG